MIAKTNEKNISEFSKIASKVIQQTLNPDIAKLVNINLTNNQYYELAQKIVLQTNNITQSLFSSLKFKETIDSIVKVQQSINKTLLPIIQSYQLNFIPLLSKLQKLWSEIPEDRKHLNLEELLTKCINEMYSNKWYPSVVCETHLSFLFDYNDITKITKSGSERRKKLLDKLVYFYYDKDFIKYLKREWKKKILSPLQRRIMSEAIRAYEHREYATTVIILSTFWQGMIYQKIGRPDAYRTDSKTKEYARQLMSQKEFPDTYSQFYDEYVYYTCNSAEDVKEDVPGRHGLAHSWYKKYPSRKEALNAILITNSLIEIPSYPIEDKVKSE